MFKIAITAGHYLGTPGKRCLKALDPKETREWWLNKRVTEKVLEKLQGYTGVQILRTDDPTGQKDISLTARTTAANNFGAEFYLSNHHNSGVKGGAGGGITVYVHPNASEEAKQWQKELYDALIAATGLKGNRSKPLATANFHELRETKMPAVLLELGFMDSQTDVPIILTEEYAEKCANAIVGVIIRRKGLQKVEDTLYRVQIGAYRKKENAEKTLAKVQAAGFTDAFITEARK